MVEIPLVGAIEFGGTKTNVAIGHRDGTILASARFPTTHPDGLIEKIGNFFQQHAKTRGALCGLGVGAFGPIVLKPGSQAYGKLLKTNKAGWSGFDLARALNTALNIDARIVTDVAAAGIGEARLGALQGVELGLYLTIGTGIGGAVLLRGLPLPAHLHPEMGHLLLQRQAGDFSTSSCHYHHNCAEGLVAGPAISARFGNSLSAFAPNGREYQLVANYLGQLCASLVLAISPERIVVGGGVSKATGLIEMTHNAMLDCLGEYGSYGLADPGFITPPELGDHSGIVGALSIA